MMAVTITPTARETSGLDTAEIKPRKAGLCFRGAMAPLMVCIPLISTENASMIIPRFFWVGFLQKKYRMMPMKATKENMVAEEMPPPSSIPASTRIQPVAVVPMLAPIMIPMALASFIIPELTKPTTMTVVADDDWMTAVTKAPSRTPRKVVDVSFARMISSLPPAMRLRPSPSSDMPKRKNPKPPNRAMVFAIPMCRSDLSVNSEFIPIIGYSVAQSGHTLQGQREKRRKSAAFRYFYLQFLHIFSICL